LWRQPNASRIALRRQELQAKIESYNKIVAAVLKLCERLETQHDVSAAAAALQGSSGDPDARESQVVVGASCADGEEGRCEGEIGGGGEAKALHMLAIDFERRWHAVWLQSLEWQCRLEEAINSRAWVGAHAALSANLFTLDLLFFVSHPPLGRAVSAAWET